MKIINNQAGYFVKYKNTDGNLILVNVKSITSIEFKDLPDDDVKITIMLTIGTENVKIVADQGVAGNLYDFFVLNK